MLARQDDSAPCGQVIASLKKLECRNLNPIFVLLLCRGFSLSLYINYDIPVKSITTLQYGNDMFCL